MVRRAKTTCKKDDARYVNLSSQRQAAESPLSINSPLNNILSLQRTIGNHAMQNLFESKAVRAKPESERHGNITNRLVGTHSDVMMRILGPGSSQPEDVHTGAIQSAQGIDHDRYAMDRPSNQWSGNHAVMNQEGCVGYRNVNPMTGQFEPRGGYSSAITAGDVTEPGTGTQPTTVHLSPAPAGKSSKATPPKLSKKTVVGPMDTIDCGGYHWAVKWNLDKPTTKGGYVVQMVASWVNVKDCKGKPVRVQDRVRSYNPKNYPFWESWKIGKNQTGTGKSRDDSYTWLQGVGVGTKGFIQVRGYATFYEGLTLPSSFKVVPNSPAQLAPMTRTNPNLPHGPDTVLHTLTASWDCCPGSKSKKTRLKAR